MFALQIVRCFLVEIHRFFSFSHFLGVCIVTGIGEAERKVRHGVGRTASHHQDDGDIFRPPGDPGCVCHGETGNWHAEMWEETGERITSMNL